MKQSLLSASRLGSLACLLVIHLWTATASRAAILAGPITNAANGHIYYLLSPTNWPAAEAEAVGLRGHLATINDAAENTWVFNTFGNYGGVARSLWIGLNDIAQEGNWVWVGGETSSYRNWAPGEPNNGGGFYPNEDQAVMRGPAQAYSDSWNDAPGEQVHAAVVEVAVAAPPTNTGAYDVASGFSTNSNPNGVWSYGSSATLGGQMTLFPDRGKWSGLEYWRAPILLGVPGVYRNPANITVTNGTGTAVLGPRQLSFYPGPNGEFCLIRFTAPAKGIYQVSGAFTGVDPHGTTTDVHILVNGVVFNGSVNGYGAGSGPTFNLIVDLNAGAPLDFVVGRSANSQFSFDSTGLSVQIIPPLVGIPPTITSQPQSRTVNAGTNVTFLVTATGTAPLSYQWRRNGTNLLGATGTFLTLSNVQPANAGTYSVRVTNAFGAATSSNAVLTVLLPPTNCVSAPTGLVSWWRAEGNAKDAVGTNNGTAPFGMSYAAGEVGGAFDFNGTNASVSMPAAASLDVGQGSGFSVECSIKPARIADAQPLVEWFRSPGPPFGVHFWISESGSGTGPGCLYVNIPDTFGGEHKFSSAKGIVGTNSWQHVALTYERASGLTKMFYNGTVVALQTLGFYTPQTSYGLYLGRRPPSTYPYQEAFFKGGMDEVAIYNRALSTNEIQAIFNSGSAGRCPPPTGIPPTITSQPQSQTVNAGTNVTFFVTATGTAPLSYQWRRNTTNLTGATGTSLTLSNVQPANAGTYSVRVTNAFGAVTSSNAVLTVLLPPTNCVSAPTGLVSWWRAESNALDSRDGNHGTLAGNATYGSGKSGSAFVFDGNRDGVMVGTGTNMQLQNFSIEGWIKRTSTAVASFNGNGNGEIFVVGTNPGGFGFRIQQSDNRLVLGKSGGFQVSSAAQVTDTNWHHVAVTKLGTRVVFYVDGVAHQAPPFDSGPFTFSAPAYIGAWLNPNGIVDNSFYGAIDELAVYSRELTATEIQAVYAAGNAGKCGSAAGVAPAISVQPQSQTVPAGAYVTFFVTATGTSPLRYQWRRNGDNLPGATNSSLTLSNVQPANAGNYSVRVTNAFGAVTSSNAVLTVVTTSTNCVGTPTGLVSWWRADSNFVDSVDSNHGTSAGNTTFGAGRVGQGFVFDGNGDGMRIGNPTNLQLQNFTIESWIKRTSSSVVSFSLGGLWAEFLCYGGGGYAFGLLGNGRLFLSKVDIDQTQTTVAITDTNFHHVAVTKAGSVVVFYIDGIAYPVEPYNTTYTFTQPAAIGARGDNLTGSFYGRIDELAVYGRALSASEVQGIYHAGGSGKCGPPTGVPPTITSQPQSRTVNAGTNVTFSVTATGTTPLSYQWRRNETNLPGATGTSLTLSNVQPANAGTYSVRVTNAFGAALSSNAVLTVLATSTNCVSAPTGLVSWWRAESNAVDAVDGNNGIMSEGMRFASGKVGQAFRFNGTNAQVRVPASPNLNVGAGNGFTIETWINPADVANQRPLVEWNDGSTVGVHLWLSVPIVGGSGLYLNVLDTSLQNRAIATAPGTIVTNVYQHVAATFNKTNGVAALYINGKMIVQTALGVFTPRTIGDLYFGFRPAGLATGTHYIGAMDEVSIYNRALGSNEVAAIYAAGSAGKCVPTGNAPAITSQPQSRTVNAGSNVTFSVTATGTAPLSFQWRRNETNLPGANGTSLTLSNVQPANAGVYSVRVTNAFGAVISSNAVLTVLSPPSPILAGPITNPANGHVYYLIASNTWTGAEAQAVTLGGHLVTINDATENAWVLGTFGSFGGVARPLWIGLNDAAVEGVFVWASGEAATYRNWMPGEPNNGGGFVPDEDYVGMRGPGLSFSNAWNDTLNSDHYVAVVEIVPLGPLNIAPTITSHPQSRTVPAGTNVTFFVTATGTAPLSYQWRRNETNLAGATGTSLTLSNVQPLNAGTYSVRVTNAFGAITSSNAVLTVLTTSTKCASAPAGLVSWWRAEGNANDSVGTNNGTTPFEMGYAAGEVGQAFNFIGTSRRVTVPDSPVFRLTNSFAVEGWIYARQSNSGVIFMRGDNRAGLDPILLSMLQSPGNVSFQIQNANGQSVLLQAPVQINQWQHIAATLDGTNGNMTVYVNGVLRAQTNTTIRPLANLEPQQQPAIGIGNHGGTIQQFPFNGLIDEISLYSRALSQTEFQAIYHAGSSGKCIHRGRIAGAIGLATLVREPGTHPVLSFAGVAGKTYTVQASTNLKDWEVVGVSVADPNGICEFEDRVATKFPCRYYRIVVP